MKARTATLVLVLSAVALVSSCSWNPFRSSQPTEPTQPAQAQAPADTSAAPQPASKSDTQRGVWPTTPPPPVTGREIDDGREKKTCTTAQRLRWDC